MKILISSVQQAISNKNWFAALFLSLTLPDICGSLESPSSKVGERYKKWCSKYLINQYHLLNAEDCYALRNACLHSCLDSNEKMSVSRMHFVIPRKDGIVIHGNRLDDVLQLQIDRFCNDICNGVRKWEEEVNSNLEITERVNELMKIHEMISLEPYIKIS
jgi:hypothetical protein